MAAKINSDTKITTIQNKVKRIKKENTRLNQELQEKNEKILRLYADLQNAQKRMEKELQFKEEETKIRYLSELIDIYELLQKAYDDNTPKEGMKAILNNVKNYLEKEQVSYIDCIGKPFDHNCHHAISTILDDGGETDTIKEEVKKGYMLGEKILRPSQVIVRKKKNDIKTEGE